MDKRMVAGALILAMMLPALASAQTAAPLDVQAQVQSLLSQIRALQEQLKNLIASSAASLTPAITGAPGQIGKAACIRLARNLREGSSGDDVRSLQEILREDLESGFTSSATGFFGPMTARAVAKWQMRMGIASTSDGSIGPLTRGFLERRCVKGLGANEDHREKTIGTISAVGSSSITVQERDGESRVVHVTASTTIHVLASASTTPTTGTFADLAIGKHVAATGKPNDDDSINALRIEVGVPPAPLKILKFNNRGKKMTDDDDNGDD